MQVLLAVLGLSTVSAGHVPVNQVCSFLRSGERHAARWSRCAVGALLVAFGATLLVRPTVSMAQATEIAPEFAVRLAERVDAFDASLDRVNRLSGVLRVVHGDSLLLEKAFGYANRELEVPNTSETRFCIASITKIMTRLIAWQILVEGKCRLDSPLSSFVADFPHGDAITVEHLMRHRAGVPHRVVPENEQWHPVTAEEVTRFAADYVGSHGTLVVPGRESIYSSGGYSVLARVIEIIEGRSFSEVLQERVFGPAGMHDSFDVDGRTLLRHRAQGYVPGLDALLNAPAKDLSFLVGAGSVYSTAADLERFFRAFRGDTFGSAAWSSLQSEGSVTWIGATNGFHSFLKFDPSQEFLVIYTGNSFGGGSGQLQDAIDEFLAGNDVEGRPRPSHLVSVDLTTLRGYAGDYETRPGATLSVGVRSGQLTIADSVAPALSETEFYFQNWSRPVSFIKDPEAGEWSLRSTNWEGTVETWRKVR